MTLPGLPGTEDAEDAQERSPDALALDLTVLGDPVPWAAKSTNRKTGNRFVQPRQEEAIGRVLGAVERAGTERLEDGVPLLVEATFWIRRPKGHYGTGRNARLLKPSAPRFPAGRPDYSNLVKLIEDGLTLSGVLPDDDQIVGFFASEENRKLYAASDEVPRSRIRLYFA